MANISKKEIRKRRRIALEKLGLMPDHILCGRLTLMGGRGKSPNYNKYGKISNQKGAFGSVKWKKGLKKGVYATFSMTNHEKHLASRLAAEAKRGFVKETPMAREL